MVRGLTLAMGGSVEARASSLGGLAVVARFHVDRVEEPEAATDAGAPADSDPDADTDATADAGHTADPTADAQ